MLLLFYWIFIYVLFNVEQRKNCAQFTSPSQRATVTVTNPMTSRKKFHILLFKLPKFPNQWNESILDQTSHTHIDLCAVFHLLGAFMWWMCVYELFSSFFSIHVSILAWIENQTQFQIASGYWLTLCDPLTVFQSVSIPISFQYRLFDLCVNRKERDVMWQARESIPINNMFVFCSQQLHCTSVHLYLFINSVVYSMCTA